MSSKRARGITLLANSVAERRYSETVRLVREATGGEYGFTLSGPQVLSLLADLALPQLREMTRTVDGINQLKGLALASINAGKGGPDIGDDVRPSDNTEGERK